MENLTLAQADLGWSHKIAAYCKIIAAAEFSAQDFAFEEEEDDEKKDKKDKAESTTVDKFRRYRYTFNEDRLFKLDFSKLSEEKQASFVKGLILCMESD